MTTDDPTPPAQEPKALVLIGLLNKHPKQPTNPIFRVLEGSTALNPRHILVPRRTTGRWNKKYLLRVVYGNTR